MKKATRIFAAALAVVLTLALAACGGSPNSQSTSAAGAPAQSTPADAGSAPAAADGKITIAYWTTNRHDQAYMTPLIEEFNQTNDKNIYIDYQVYADNYSQMLDLAFSTGTAPDVYQLSGTDPLEIAVKEKGQLLDLAPYMDDAYRARFGEGAFVEGINAIGDGIYSLPYTASAARLFYNQDIFDRVGIEAPPTTLDELVADAKLITEQLSGEGIYGISGNFKSAASSVARSIDMIVMRSGGTRSGFDYKTGTYDFSSYKPVLEAFREMFATGVAFPGSESLDIDPMRTQFAAGNIGMYFSISHAEPGVYASQFPTEENWNCAQLPTVNGTVEGKQQLWFGGSNIGINPATEHPDEAWEVMKFLHSDEVMGPYHTAGLGTVMIPSAVEKAEAPETISVMPNLAINADDQNWPPLPAGVVVEGKDYYTVVVECIFGLADIDSSIEDLNQRYNAAYDKLVEGGAQRIVYPNFDPMKQDTSK